MRLTPPCDWCPAEAPEPGVFGWRAHPGQNSAVRHACSAHRVDGEAWFHGQFIRRDGDPPPAPGEGQGKLL